MYQSPGAGVPTVVVPPTVESLSDVKYTGLAAVPDALTVPEMVIIRKLLPLILITTPGSIVSVAPSATVMLDVRI